MLAPKCAQPLLPRYDPVWEAYTAEIGCGKNHRKGIYACLIF